jgi:uncharacterized phage protein (TIGR01671 family)
MREILFRAKRIDNGEWVEGWYVLNRMLLPEHLKHQGKHYICVRFTYTNSLNEMEYYEVDPATVGQFTGLRDRNGERIWEGDIIDVQMAYGNKYLPHCGEIVYSQEWGAFGTKNDSGTTLLHHHLLSTATVTGNIHDGENGLEGE